MRRKAALQSSATMRERILHAAVLRFSRHTYDETGLRDIAADVGVDVAYVHRCFGSKQRLFAEAVDAAVQAEKILSGATGDLPASLTKELFPSDVAKAANEVQRLDIFIRSLLSPEASKVVHESMLEDFVSPLAARLGDRTKQRAALITAFLVGVAICRNVLRIEPLVEPAGGKLEKLIRSTIDRMMTASIITKRK